MTPDRTCANLGGSRAIKNVPPPRDHRCILLDEHTFTKRSGEKKRVCSSARSGSTGLKGKLTGHYNPNVLSGPSGGMNRVESPPRATDERSGKHPPLRKKDSATILTVMKLHHGCISPFQKQPLRSFIMMCAWPSPRNSHMGEELFLPVLRSIGRQIAAINTRGC